MNTRDFYRATHPYCEACSLALSALHIHHIRTRAASGDDDPSNLLALCAEHHAHIHTMGVQSFARSYPKLRDKIMLAIGRPKGGVVR